MHWISDNEKPKSRDPHNLFVCERIIQTGNQDANKHNDLGISGAQFLPTPVSVHFPSHPCMPVEFLNVRPGSTLTAGEDGLYID